jgi:hypothetical protein
VGASDVQSFFLLLLALFIAQSPKTKNITLKTLVYKLSTQVTFQRQADV